MIVDTPAPTAASVIATSGAFKKVNNRALRILIADKAIIEFSKSLANSENIDKQSIKLRNRIFINFYPLFA
jgi:hypothetical protein